MTPKTHTWGYACVSAGLPNISVCIAVTPQQAYAHNHRYHLLTLQQYEMLLTSVGFVDLKVQDKTSDVSCRGAQHKHHMSYLLGSCC